MTNSYTKGEERANWISHAFGAVLSLAAGAAFIFRFFSNDDPYMKVGILLYILGMLSSYVCSTAYHSSPDGTPLRAVLRKFDHAAIYWFIAGSYSPLMLVAMRDVGCWGWSIFTAVWVCALAGTIVTFCFMREKSIFKTLCYVAMGLMIVIAIKPFSTTVTPAILWLIIGEGICYITGAVFYSVYKVKYLHFVFHLFVMAGSLCHFIAVWKMMLMYY